MYALTETSSERIVVILDDDDVFRGRLCRAFESRGWMAQGANTSESAIAAVRELEPDLVLVDLRLATGSGLEAIPVFRDIDPELKVIMLTGYGSIATALTATKLGADDYISKPVDVDEILSAYARSFTSEQRDLTPANSVPSLARVEWEHIQRILQDCGGNISQAARLLGLHRRSLQRKLEKYPPPQ
jgi:two-component system, response regulator RegA